MPRFESTQDLPRPVEEVFAFFRRPANLLRVSPPELQLKLVEAPESLEVGSRIVLVGQRLGFKQQLVNVVTALEPNRLIQDEQQEGPFGKWSHQHHFEAIPGGTRVRDVIEFEPPGGLLGLVLKVGVIERDLRAMFDHRQEKLREFLGPNHSEEDRREVGG
jgi:ligand-binding SRPBCC domain-containing protein